MKSMEFVHFGIIYPSIVVRLYLGFFMLTQEEVEMEWNLLFFFNSILLGVGLAMDTFSVSLANGLNEPHMRAKKMCIIAGTFGFFQAFMPMTGWFCVHTIVEYFKTFEKFIPWIALFLLLYIGGKMVWEGLYGEEEAEEVVRLEAAGLLMQGIATSIDALSVGFTIADYGFVMALVCSLIIAATTFCISYSGLIIGKKFGTQFADRATVFGGVILIFIGLEIFITGIF